MAKAKEKVDRLSWVVESISASDRVGPPFAEDGTPKRTCYYTELELRAIWDCLAPQRPNASILEFSKAIESVADWFVEYTHGRRDHKDGPAQQKRQWERLQRKVDDLQASLSKLSPPIVNDLLSVAFEVAQQEGGLPNLEPEKIPLQRLSGSPNGPEFLDHWPADHQWDIAKSNINWLSRVLREAASRAGAEIGIGGNRPDEPFHQFVRALGNLWPKFSNATPKAYMDGEEGEPTGAFLHYLSAACIPLGHDGSPEALLSTWRRALHATPQVPTRPVSDT